MTKNKLIYHALSLNRWKGSVKPLPFFDLLILDMINQFIFGHGVVIYYKQTVKPVKYQLSFSDNL